MNEGMNTPSLTSGLTVQADAAAIAVDRPARFTAKWIQPVSELDVKLMDRGAA